MRPGFFMPKFARKGNRMRQFIVASHAHFASGIVESIGLLSGERENVDRVENVGVRVTP